jgi:glutathione S-transferase
VYDSSVIVEYLDALASGGRIIPDGGGRFAAVTRQSLADGIMDAGILRRYEQRFRAPEFRSSRWVEHQCFES